MSNPVGVVLISVGHGSLDKGALSALLHSASIEAVVDIRRYPNSRRNPDVASDAMQIWLPETGIDYRWDVRLGGRRRTPAGAPREDPWWQVDQFASYAAHTRTPVFSEALADLLEQAAGQPTAMMCSESVWWRCHRRLVADVAVLKFDKIVDHLMHDGRLAGHVLADGARLREDGHVAWDKG